MAKILTVITALSLFLIVLLFLGGILFYGVAFPLWMVVHCATSRDLSRKAQALWIAGIVLLWSLGAALYAMFGSRTRLLQGLSGFFFILCLCFGLVFVAVTRYAASTIPVVMQQTTQRVETVQMPGLSAEDRAHLKSSVETLAKEMNGPWYQMEKKQIAWELQKLLVSLMDDGRLTAAELKSWMAKFESRNLLDAKALKQDARQRRRKGASVE